jgi:hypothetical protein
MMGLLAQVVAWLNAVANALGGPLFAPVALLPGWLSATIVSVVTGILLLAVFKYTSNQRAIKRVRDDIDANMLALKLFKDSTAVSLRAQGRLLAGAGRLFVLAIVPMLVMIVPVALLLGQLSLWYQARPLQVGEETVLTLKLGGNSGSPLPAVTLQPSDAVEVAAGPVHIPSQRELCWRLVARRAGEHRLRLQVGDQSHDKDLAIGEGFLRVSPLRPGWDWMAMLENPWEPPFRPGSAVQSIELVYPDRSSWTSGTNWWIGYWFVVSFIAAFAFRDALGVHV